MAKVEALADNPLCSWQLFACGELVYRLTPKVRRTLTEGVGLYDRSSITLRPYCVGWAYQTWFTFKISLRSPEGLAGCAPRSGRQQAATKRIIQKS